MRRTSKGLLAAAALTFGAFGAGTAGAITMTPPDAATTQIPSCSLHPYPNGDGTITFTKDPAKDVGNSRFLQVVAEDGTLLFNAWLDPGSSTEPLTVTPATIIHWASAVYPVNAYELDDPPWCGDVAVDAEQATTTTEAPAAAAPTTTAAAPTTTGPPAAAAPTTAAPTTTEPAPTVTTGPPTITAVPIVQVDAPVDEPIVLSPAGSVGVAGVTVTRTLASTGAPVSPAAMALTAAALLVVGFVVIAGSNAVSALRRDMRRPVR